MEIVVDTNIMISALLKDNLTRRILLLSPFDMYTLACAHDEIQKYKEELIHKSKLNNEQFDYLIQLLFSKMNFVPAEDIEPFKDSAITIMRDIDPDDSPSLALAMMLNAPIWSNDSHFKRQKAAPVFNTKEILPLLGN
jgi:predicted nucleic acid-binding protein